MTTPAPALPVLKDLATGSGLEPKVLQLLPDHGVTNSGSFFHTFQEPAAVKKLLQPTTLGEGVKLSTGTFVKLDDVQFLVATSVFAHMVDEIRVARAARVACDHHSSSECGIDTCRSHDQGAEDAARQLLGRLPRGVPVRDHRGHCKTVSYAPPVRCGRSASTPRA